MRESELSKRVVTGVLGGLLLLSLIVFGGRPGVALIAAVISLGMIYEFIEMVFTLPDKTEKRLVIMGITWLVAFINFWIPRAEYELFLMAFLGLFFYYLFTAGRHRGPLFGNHFQELMYSIFGVIYLAFLPLFMPLISDSASGSRWMILFLLIVWSGDSGAYFVGKKYGKRKLYPLISPKKTVEGSLGGLAAGIVITFLYKLIVFRALPWGAILIVPLLVGVVSQVGDLCESFLKRSYDRKDSGSILPGHGGFLDRFDGVVLSLPIMYACVRLFS